MEQHNHHYTDKHTYNHFQHIRDNVISGSNTTNSPLQSPGAHTEQTSSTTTPIPRTYLDVHSHPSLPRVDSTASFVAEACHIEDVNAGCQLHSHPSDIALSRYTVVNGHLLREGQPRPEAEEGQQQHRIPSIEEKRGQFF